VGFAATMSITARTTSRVDDHHVLVPAAILTQWSGLALVCVGWLAGCLDCVGLLCG
jgi:hypothetical protein